MSALVDTARLLATCKGLGNKRGGGARVGGVGWMEGVGRAGGGKEGRGSLEGGERSRKEGGQQGRRRQEAASTWGERGLRVHVETQQLTTNTALAGRTTSVARTCGWVVGDVGVDGWPDT